MTLVICRCIWFPGTHFTVEVICVCIMKTIVAQGCLRVCLFCIITFMLWVQISYHGVQRCWDCMLHVVLFLVLTVTCLMCYHRLSTNLTRSLSSSPIKQRLREYMLRRVCLEKQIQVNQLVPGRDFASGNVGYCDNSYYCYLQVMIQDALCQYWTETYLSLITTSHMQVKSFPAYF